MKVKKEKCDQCLFTESRIVSKERAADIIRGCLENDENFLCHKGTIDGEEIVCCGSFEHYRGQLARIADRLDAVEFVD